MCFPGGYIGYLPAIGSLMPVLYMFGQVRWVECVSPVCEKWSNEIEWMKSWLAVSWLLDLVLIQGCRQQCWLSEAVMPGGCHANIWLQINLYCFEALFKVKGCFITKLRGQTKPSWNEMVEEFLLLTFLNLVPIFIMTLMFFIFYFVQCIWSDAYLNLLLKFI